ncbi:ABC transporter permease [Marinicella sp. W31]|uniref:ABC transporter permease n=1 Tax=Marinicella sp. W31 TaxID=3023713 RepID=UPI0037571BC6
MLFKLALSSLIHRKTTVILTLISLFIGITLLFAVGFIKSEAKTSFTKTVSGTDLIVGAKTSQINLLLYSIFRLGDPTSNISWDSYEFIKNHKAVDWTVPISLGDSHKGYRVVGTTQEYYQLFQFGDEQKLKLKSGHFFEGPLDVVLGSEVATKLNYSVGELITLSHGIGQSSFTHHDQVDFTVTGILNKTGTPVDQSLFVGLGSIELIHEQWPSDPSEKQELIQKYKNNTILPQSITAAYVGLKSKSMAFVFQRQINTHEQESLMAILPGVALASLWRMVSFIEDLFMIIAIFVLFATLVSLVVMLLSSLHMRKKELALLRMIGASPFFCFLLIQFESLLIVLGAIMLSFVFLLSSLTLLSEWISTQFGLYITLSQLASLETLFVIAVILLVSFLITLIPSVKYYKQSIMQNISKG